MVNMKRTILPVLLISLLLPSFTMSNNILQWNCRSIKANYEELTLLVNELEPVAVCLQETFLKESDQFTPVTLKTVVITIKLPEVLL